MQTPDATQNGESTLCENGQLPNNIKDQQQQQQQHQLPNIEEQHTAQFVLAPGAMEHVEGTMIQNDLVFVAADIESRVAPDESAAAESTHEATEASTMGATSELCSALGENSSSELYESMVILSNMHKYMFSR